MEVLNDLLQWKDILSPIKLLAVLPNASSSAAKEVRMSLGPSIDFTHCFYRNSSMVAPSSYILKSVESDSRTLVNYNELEEMTIEDFKDALSKLSGQLNTIYHFEGRIVDVTASCIDHVRTQESNAVISVEIEKAHRYGLQNLAQKADVVFYSKSWAEVSGFFTYWIL